MIKLLDKATIDKIAAGEVIERPSSVVKELLENSIDAGATSVTVEIKEGGIDFIRVTDNGCGIPKDQVKTAYLRHATSKIDSADDLEKVASLGFRGEALSTIAAVSQTEMITKTKDELTGIKYVIHGGTEIEFKEVGVPDGTTIVVRNLFYNTPARKKFLKTPMTEGSYIQDLVLKLALSRPDISLKLIINNQTKIDTSGNGSTKDAIYQLFGRDITANLIPIDYEAEDIRISGFIGKPFISRGNRGLENYFINKRYIKSNVVNRAIEEGYRTFVMQHKFPFTVMYIELPADKCDVNVHPTKMEFKYYNEKGLFEAITRAVRDALTHKEIIPKSSEENLNPDKAIKQIAKETAAISKESKVKPQININAGKYSPTYNILESLKKSSEEGIDISNLIKDEGAVYTSSKNTEKESVETTQKTPEPIKNNDEKITAYKTITEKPATNPAIKAYVKAEKTAQEIKDNPEIVTGKQTSLFDDDFLTDKARKKHRVIGQVFGTFWLIQYENNLYIMDQHAAHEKVKYEELLNNLNGKEILSQQLMPPLVVTVSYAERQAILEYYDLFMKVGFDIEEFGGNEFKINSVPSNLYGMQERQIFMEFVGSLINNAGYVSNDLFVKKLSTMACKAAIKGNTRISLEEADALIDQLLKLDNPYTCPHGRPTIISMSEAELEKKFKRIV
ncbi:MAG: DNA mismatch repair endonuclease MutL [Lachnospiraceae bacterium]|nr:DNA mismatch repair endonuclease MutL [Lachnospiraceae bacterium]